MHPAKRRRLDESTSTLSKPFRSPLRVDVKPQDRHINHNEQVAQTHTANVTDHEIGTSLPSITDLTTCKHQPSPPSNSSPIRKPSNLLSSSPRAPSKDAEYLSLQKQHSALVVQLSKLRQSLDTAQQALKIESTNADLDLEVLISKWKLVSREAAEELFRGARDRVNRMGGVGAWRERNSKQQQVWEEEEEPVNEDDLTEEQKVLLEEQKGLIEQQKQDMEAEMKKYGTAKTEDVIERDDEVRSIHTSLRSPSFETDCYC